MLYAHALQILHVLLRKAPHALTSEQIAKLAASTHGFVGADLQVRHTDSVFDSWAYQCIIKSEMSASTL